MKSPKSKKSTPVKPAKIEEKIKYKNIMKIEEGVYPYHTGDGSLGKHRAKSKRVNETLGKYSLTEKQAKVLSFVSNHINTVGFPPTVRQVASYFGVSAKAAHDHMRAIAKKGYLRLFPGSARGMEVVRMDDDSHTQVDSKNTLSQIIQDTVGIPLLGTIAAGVPILAEENVDSMLSFPRSFLPKTGNMFALKVKGESMIEAGIFDGDIAVLKQVSDVNTEIKNGDIVAALLDGEATLKEFLRKKSHIELLPKNSSFKSIIVSGTANAAIIGLLVGVYRRY